MTLHALTPGHYPDTTDRRHALLELAEQVVIERAHNVKPWTNVYHDVAPALVNPAIRPLLLWPSLSVAFHDLCEAVATRHRYVADPDSWLVEHGKPLGQASVQEWDEATEAAVQVAVDRVMAVRS